MSSTYQLPVLLYHRVINSSCKVGKHKLYVYEAKFRKQMQWLKYQGYETITFRELQQLPANSDLTKKIVLTFDDGYEDNYTILFPILKEYGFKAVIFLVTGLKQNDWGIKEGEPAVDLMTNAQLKEMAAYGIEFGGHTQYHIDLKHAPVEQQKSEIEGCYNDLRQLFGKEPISFSYPFGAYNEATIQLTKNAGFKFGITTIFGPNNWSEDHYRIRRIEMRPNNGLMAFKRKASGRYLCTNWFNYFFTK